MSTYAHAIEHVVHSAVMVYVTQPISFVTRLAKGFAGGVMIAIGFFALVFWVESDVPFMGEHGLAHADAPVCDANGNMPSFERGANSNYVTLKKLDPNFYVNANLSNCKGQTSPKTDGTTGGGSSHGQSCGGDSHNSSSSCGHQW